MNKYKTPPILLQFPDEFETERLIIRAPRPGDGALLNEAVRESHDSLKPWFNWAQTLPTLDESEANVRQAALKFQARKDLRLHMFRKSDDKFLGSTGLHRVNWDVPSFEIGYWLRDSATKQGYMTEAVNGITDFAFNVLNAQRVEIQCDAKNKRSAAVAERCGYTLEGSLRNHDRDVYGNLADLLIYAKVVESD